MFHFSQKFFSYFIEKERNDKEKRMEVEKGGNGTEDCHPTFISKRLNNDQKEL